MKKSIALITSHAPSLVNFRSLLIHSLHAQGLQVFALAPNFDERTRTAMQALEETFAILDLPAFERAADYLARVRTGERDFRF